ncbi:unnamed protein product [Miscanthus lutarioriparius]|uniref:Uncharacterized protein n=1 Tax=Miscanthus lutarioriparius TaxID=422564 RepID=A0A811RFW5_9POAL|nr:unnamed protein product [Miscanthus lutarioriparius]
MGEDARAPPCSPPRAPSPEPRRLGHPALPPVPSCTMGGEPELGLDKNEPPSLRRTPPAKMLVRRCSGQHRPRTQESGSCHLPPAAPRLGHWPFVKHEVRVAAGVELDFGPELDMDDACHVFDEMPAWRCCPLCQWHCLFPGNCVNLSITLSSPNLSSDQSTRVCNVLALLQCVASHPDTRMPFVNGEFSSSELTRSGYAELVEIFIFRADTTILL